MNSSLANFNQHFVLKINLFLGMRSGKAENDSMKTGFVDDEQRPFQQTRQIL